MNHKLCSFLCALPAVTGSASAKIESGGGKATVGNLTNHRWNGGIVATTPAPLGSLTLRNGLIEILYATGPLDPDADSHATDFADAWEDDHFPGQNVVDTQAGSDGNYTSVFRSTGSRSVSIFTLPIPTFAGGSYQAGATRNLASWHLHRAATGDGMVLAFRSDQSSITIGPLHSPGQALLFSLPESVLGVFS
jgi:hypothetical protein